MHPLTKCTHCGIETTRLSPGNGCHACCRGVMQRVESENDRERLELSRLASAELRRWINEQHMS